MKTANLSTAAHALADSLSASAEIPRSRERERMSAGQVRAVGEKQFNAERAGERCREPATVDDHWIFPRRRPRPATVFTTRPAGGLNLNLTRNLNLAARGV